MYGLAALPNVGGRSQTSIRVAATDTRIRTNTLPGTGIWTSFPFGGTAASSHVIDNSPASLIGPSPCALGSTDSCPTAVHTKPFSTSVLQGLSGVFATTTKICTPRGSSRVHTQSLPRHGSDLPTRSVFRASRASSDRTAGYK